MTKGTSNGCVSTWWSDFISQNQGMNNTSSSHTPFAQLPSEARVLFFIYASAALACYGSRPPRPSELAQQLEVIWNQRRLRCDDLSDPDRMTALLKGHLVPVTATTTPDRRTRCRRMR